MAFDQALFHMLRKSRYILFGGIREQCLETDMRFDVVGETKLIQDTEFIMIFEDDRGLAWRAAQRLLFLDVVGEFAKCLAN